MNELAPRTAVIRTTDRATFRSCRRKWAWSSHLMGNLEPKQAAAPLWFGTGIHYALEDFFGVKDHPTAKDALDAYVRATVRQNRQEMPDDWKEQTELGMGMLEYFEKYWLPGRDPLTTYVHNGIPQTEVNFVVDLPFNPKEHFPDSPYDKVVYSGTIDRVTIDDDGQLWLVDYKTAKQLKTSHFANDSQVSAYCWAAYHIYQRPVAGMIYWQFLKAVPKPPEPLKSGKISVAANQRTTRPLYRQALIDCYGSVAAAPVENKKFLNQLALLEGPDHDAFIRRDRIYKNPASLQAEGVKILLELEDMLNPHLPLYPNPTFMCPHMCPFYEACVSMDDGSDWEQQLRDETQPRPSSQESWRKYIQGYMAKSITQVELDKNTIEAMDFEVHRQKLQTHDYNLNPNLKQRDFD
jgi:hypothetical protein